MVDLSYIAACKTCGLILILYTSLAFGYSDSGVGVSIRVSN
jgi:hypothetical protein